MEYKINIITMPDVVKGSIEIRHIRTVKFDWAEFKENPPIEFLYIKNK